MSGHGNNVHYRGLFKRGVLGTGLNGETRLDVVRWVFREASASMTVGYAANRFFLSKLKATLTKIDL